MDIARLRSATAPDHQAVEDCIPLMNPGLTAATYTRVLAQLHGVVAAWEHQVAVHATGTLAALAHARARLPLLDQDLHALHAAQPDRELCHLPAFDNEAQLFGAMYVMEGSRLGGQLIAKFVESHLGYERGKATSYFRGFEERTAAMWKEFLETLNTTIPDEDTEEVILGAKKMFTAFGTWMRTNQPIRLC